MSTTTSASSSSSATEAIHASQAAPGRLYNPYEGLHTMPASSSAYMRGAANTQAIYIPLQPEQLFQEEANVHRRSWAENVTYLTGCGYLMGAGMGGAVSLAAKLRAEGPPPPEVMRYRRLLANWVINGITRGGPRSGNACGVLGFYYANIESAMHYYRCEDDVYNPLVAGLATGALFSSASGPRVAAAHALYGLAFASLMQAGRYLMNAA